MKKAVAAQHHHNGTTELTPLEEIHGPLPPLQVADIILIHHKKPLMRFLLRKITESYWDHTAMVIYVKNPEIGYSHNIIEESIQFGFKNALRRGVEIHRLEKYFMRPDLYDIGIKRVPNLTDELRTRIRSFMIMNVDAPYYRLPVTDFFFAWISKSIRKFVLSRQRFSCSGLVQKAFYEASDWHNRSKLIFKKWGGTPIELQELTTPADIANSENSEWIWNKH